jgi:hypothetical protein
LTTCAKSRGQEEKKIQKKGVGWVGPGDELRPVSDQPTLARRLWVNTWPCPSPIFIFLIIFLKVSPSLTLPVPPPQTFFLFYFFLICPNDKNLLPFFEFYYFLNFIFWKFGEWARAFGRMGVQHPHFLKHAPTLGSIKSSICHGDWRFHFFQVLYF